MLQEQSGNACRLEPRAIPCSVDAVTGLEDYVLGLYASTWLVLLPRHECAVSVERMVKLLLKVEVACLRNYFLFRFLRNLVLFITVRVLLSFARILALIFRMRNIKHGL